MATAVMAGREIHVDDEGFMTDASEWTEDLAEILAKNIHIDELTEEHWKVLRFLRDDYADQGETATLRRVAMIASSTIANSSTGSALFNIIATRAMGQSRRLIT